MTYALLLFGFLIVGFGALAAGCEKTDMPIADEEVNNRKDKENISKPK